jgi:hypothetical protein
MTKGLSTIWTCHLQGKEEKEKFRSYVVNSSSLWERLGQIINEKIPDSKEHDYDKAAWAYYQADQNGYERALKEILSILPVDIK